MSHTLRNNVELRYTTAPGDLGYGDNATAWESSSPSLRLPPRALCKAWPALQRRAGLTSGTCHATDLRWADDGSPVTWGELDYMVAAADFVR